MRTKEEYYELVLENRKLASDPDILKCTCPNALCDWHGKCRECAALHRHYNDHVPFCLQPVISDKIKALAGTAEMAVEKIPSTPIEYRQYVGERDRAGRGFWQEQAAIRFGNIDKSDRLTLGSVFGFFQEAAISHAEILGAGRDALGDKGQAWVLSRISVFMERRPRYGENITVKTWPRGGEKLFALRDFEILDSAGHAAVRGSSCWLFIDIEKRRPLRIETLISTFPKNDGMIALAPGAAALEKAENPVRCGERQAAYSDLDFYGHVNNVSYIKWIEDMTSPELLEQAGQIRLDLNYISEVKPGEMVELFSSESNNCPEQPNYPVKPSGTFLYEGRRTAGGSTVFRAELRLGFQ